LTVIGSRNPLHHWESPDALVEYAANFHREKELGRIVLLEDFLKGVLYFRDPGVLDAAVSTNASYTASYTVTLSTTEENIVTAAGLDTGLHIDRLKLTPIDIESIKKHRQAGRLRKWRSLSRGLALIQAAC